MPYIRGVGSEDTEELLQDALTVAAKMLHDLEERGKEVTPGNIRRRGVTVIERIEKVRESVR